MADFVLLAWYAVRMATIAIAPVLVIYAFVAGSGKSAKLSATYGGAFWNIVVGTALLGLSELLAFYGDIEGNGTAKLASSILLLLVMVQFFMLLRSRLKQDVRQFVKRM